MQGVPFLPAFWFAGETKVADLAVTMLIVFGSAKLLEELSERFGLPGIVGQILAGILIGPSVFGWISPNEITGVMAELGVMFLLFGVGLEVDAKGLLKTGGVAVMTGVLGVIVPFASGWAFYRLWGRTNIEAVFLGVALTATSVGITAQVLAARDLLHHKAAKIILGAAVVDDILALLLLGFVTSIAEGRVNYQELAVTSGLALVFVVIIAWWGTRAVKQVASGREWNLQAGEAEFGVAMILMFGLAALSGKIGVAAIIGAFLAGMALSQSVPHRVHDLARGVTELLVPFFLAEIGLHFDLNVFRHPTTVILALILVPVAVLSKILACGLGASKYGRAVATRVGIGMIPRGEFCMVVAQAGLSLKAIQDDTYAIIVFMAVTAAALAPPLLKWSFRSILGEDNDGDDSHAETADA
jgi:Na+:H+ antiporter